MWDEASTRPLAAPVERAVHRFADMMHLPPYDPPKTHPTLITEGGGNAKAAMCRAIQEEVGLDRTLLKRAQMWVVGVDATGTKDVVSRDLRYWPRRAFGADGAVAPVLYGYPRACATVVAVAIVHLDPDESGRLDELRLQPTDTVEVSKVELRAWKEIVPTFCDEVDGRERNAENFIKAQLKPAFGWAHQRMVEIVNSNMTWIARKYAEASGLARPPALSYSRDALPLPQPEPFTPPETCAVS
jgi:hypothetical protein